MNDILFASALTLFAGLATGVGSFLALMTKRTDAKFLSVSLGFSAGVMIYVSMIEIFVKAQRALVAELGDRGGAWATVGGFFAGIALIAVIDRLVPARANPHEFPHDDDGRSRRLMRMGMLTAVAIALHNFPEGFATFVSALQEPSVAIPVAVAIALHNIPEGISVSVPIYHATGNRRKAFTWSFLSGLAEPAGGILGYLLLRPFLTDALFGVVFAGVAGIMVFVSLDKLLPTAREYGEHHLSIYGLIAGMALMALSLLLFV
ncbi:MULTISPECIES: zinc transporter ZupT [Kocuria]|uniref:zinc transporter ZupT n=1 Tax=Kocuria TaxID=57493 RepID=UPI00203B724D|nr:MULTISPECIES: zinc transporter ZupT [Kocuria]MCM3688817.1 zinc transporter ZupT [Kocuria rosea]HST72354.1 zinc transporter ZupT [Kocuria rosea]